MKKGIAALIILVIISCQARSVDKVERTILEKVILNPQIIDQLDAFIETKDSLAKSDSKYSLHSSYWVIITESEEKCYLRLMANFNYYQINHTRGFLKYRDKVITFYNTESQCNQDLINPSYLNTSTEEIEKTDDDIMIPPHEPTIVSFEISEDGGLIRI